MGKGQLNSVPVQQPMTWMEPQSHDDCYFCSIQVEGVNRKSAAKLKYPVLRSIKRPVDWDQTDREERTSSEKTPFGDTDSRKEK